MRCWCTQKDLPLQKSKTFPTRSWLKEPLRDTWHESFSLSCSVFHSSHTVKLILVNNLLYNNVNEEGTDWRWKVWGFFCRPTLKLLFKSYLIENSCIHLKLTFNMLILRKMLGREYKSSLQDQCNGWIYQWSLILAALHPGLNAMISL